MASTTEVIVTQYVAHDRYTNVVKKATAQTKQFGSAVDHVQAKMKRGATSGGIGSGLDDMASKMGGVTQAFGSAGIIIDTIIGPIKAVGMALFGAAAGAGAVTAGFAGFASQALNAYADIDSMKKGLIAITGSAEAAEVQFKRLREMAKLPGLGLDVIEGSVRLQAAGMSAAMAEKSLLAFGNALALVGKGKDDLSEVINQLSQMQSSGKIQGDELRVLAERVPQVRKAMIEAFGTASTEEINKSGRDITEIIGAIVAVMLKLPQAGNGVRNSLDNFSENVRLAMASAGESVAEMFLPALDKLSSMIESLGSSGAFKNIAEQWNKLFGGGNEDLFVNIASYTLAVMEALPSVIQTTVDMVQGIIKNLFGLMQIGARLLDEMNPFGDPLTDAMKGKGDNLLTEAAQGYQLAFDRMMERAAEFRGMATQGGSTASAAIAGGIEEAQRNPLAKIEKNTRATADSLTRQEQMYSSILGGSTLGKMGITPVELGGIRSRGGGLEGAIRNLVSMVYQEGQNAVLTNLLSQSRMGR